MPHERGYGCTVLWVYYTSQQISGMVRLLCGWLLVSLNQPPLPAQLSSQPALLLSVNQVYAHNLLTLVSPSPGSGHGTMPVQNRRRAEDARSWCRGSHQSLEGVILAEGLLTLRVRVRHAWGR